MRKIMFLTCFIFLLQFTLSAFAGEGDMLYEKAVEAEKKRQLYGILYII
ncbi:MAG: hypothetical protein ABRQ39_08645 [Candidatus Eremiobacterota bacterium]